TIVIEGPSAEPVTRTILHDDSAWKYRYLPQAPPQGWVERGFDDSAWVSGAAPIGYGSALVETDLNPVATTKDRPRAVYFRSTFEVDDASSVLSLDWGVARMLDSFRWKDLRH